LSVFAPVAYGATDAPIAGGHVVQKGETLYCLGRGYGVLPSAIAAANGLSMFAHLLVGQMLKIPAVQWVGIPPGPVCAPQFTPPFPSLYSGTPIAATSTPTLSPTPTPSLITPTPTAGTATPGVGQTYLVKRGDNLFRIGLRFGVTVAALKSANGLVKDLIYPNWVLVIPGVGGTTATNAQGCPTGCITQPTGCAIKGNVSIETHEKIYHVPGGAFYDATLIRPEYGERWFCTEAEAMANGWRKSER